MSGGVAYVLDETGDFAATKCNRAIVDLDPLSAEDEDTVQALIRKHVDATESKRGAFILDNWDTLGPKFVKVFPQDYKRVLAARQQKETSAQHAEKEAVHG